MERTFCGIPIEILISNDISSKVQCIVGEFIWPGKELILKEGQSFDQTKIEVNTEFFFGKYIRQAENGSIFVINSNRRWGCSNSAANCSFKVYVIVNGHVLTSAESSHFDVKPQKRSSGNSSSKATAANAAATLLAVANAAAAAANNDKKNMYLNNQKTGVARFMQDQATSNKKMKEFEQQQQLAQSILLLQPPPPPPTSTLPQGMLPPGLDIARLEFRPTEILIQAATGAAPSSYISSTGVNNSTTTSKEQKPIMEGMTTYLTSFPPPQGSAQIFHTSNPYLQQTYFSSQPGLTSMDPYGAIRTSGTPVTLTASQPPLTSAPQQIQIHHHHPLLYQIPQQSSMMPQQQLQLLPQQQQQQQHPQQQQQIMFTTNPSGTAYDLSNLFRPIQATRPVLVTSAGSAPIMTSAYPSPRGPSIS